MLIGGLVGGYLSDLMGRRSTLSYSLALNATAGLLSAFAPTFGLLSLFRVLAGIGQWSAPGSF
jgi:MFS family permease